ncbi:IS1595 family transposase [Mesorhizobium sp. B2-4-19]|uniref:IS1595 family transposase n=1 Tax=Mesorhizobium sp. B2-4-19 TaxID=2589930 RepID=UPI0015E2A008|nr:IS1595 family transposase [Mesorhizobium sp. B2-4-19]
MSDALFPTRWQYDKPPPIEEFVRTFPDDYACGGHLAEKRWPDGFVCPHCGSRKGWRLEARPWLWECAGKGDNPKCRKQTSVIAGTFMQGTHLPLNKWFMAAYLMTTHSNSISALQLQPKIGVTYKTAWLLLHKLRRVMVNPERTPLAGNVEADETLIPVTRRMKAAAARLSSSARSRGSAGSRPAGSG